MNHKKFVAYMGIPLEFMLIKHGKGVIMVIIVCLGLILISKILNKDFQINRKV